MRMGLHKKPLTPTPISQLPTSEQAEIGRMRQASGNVTSPDPLTAFFYLLARDHLPLGEIEKIVDEAVKVSIDNHAAYTNGWLAKWAEDRADALR